MTANKKRIYLSVLGVGVCVLLYDVVSGDDRPASASGADSGQASATATANDANLEKGLAALSVPPFPRDLVDSTSFLNARDLFAPSETVLRKLIGPKNDPNGEGLDEGVVIPPVPIPFGERHVLSAIIKSRGVRSAIVSGKMVRKGQRLSDCIVREIGDRNVRFDCNGIEEELWMVDPLLGERSQD